MAMARMVWASRWRYKRPGASSGATTAAPSRCPNGNGHPGLRRRVAYEITAAWETFADERAPELAELLAQPPQHDRAMARALLQQVRSYLDTPPPRGRVRTRRLADGRALVRADGEGWTFIGATTPAGYLLLDAEPHAITVIEPAEAAPLCEDLAAQATG